MTWYLISGLGADERVFDYLDVKAHTSVIKWLEPEYKESLEDYTQRLSFRINQTEEFGIIGVSFGGIVAIELSNICKPKKKSLFLVSQKRANCLEDI
jgi:esterase/lipase